MLLYRLIVQRGARPQKLVLFAWLLLYNRADLQWCTQRRKLCLFSIDERLRIAISTVISTRRNMSCLSVECGMSAGCNSVIDRRDEAKATTFVRLERNHSTTVENGDSDASGHLSCQKWRINFEHLAVRFLCVF